MKFTFENKLTNFTNHDYWNVKEHLKNGYCIFSHDQIKLRIHNSSNFNLIKEVEYPTNLAIYADGDYLLTWNNGQIFKYQISNDKVQMILERDYVDGDYGGFMGQDYLFESRRIYEKFKTISKIDRIIDLKSKKVKIEENDIKTEFVNFEKNFYKYYKTNKTLKKVSSDFERIDWEINLNAKIDFGYSKLYEDKLYLITSDGKGNKINCCDNNNGNILWAADIIGEKIYIKDSQIIILSNQQINRINTNTGEAIESTTIDYLKTNNCYISSHLTDMIESLIFFTATMGIGEDKKSIIGMFDLNANEVKIEELEMESEGDLRSPIGRPFIFKEVAYIEFSPKTLRKYRYAI